MLLEVLRLLKSTHSYREFSIETQCRLDSEVDLVKKFDFGILEIKVTLLNVFERLRGPNLVLCSNQKIRAND